MPRLVIKAPDGEVSYLELGSNPVLVGREGNVDILFNSPEVSRKHARIVSMHGSYVVEDLGSANGTSLDGQLVTRPTTVKNKSQIKIADYLIILESESADDSPSPALVGQSSPVLNKTFVLPQGELDLGRVEGNALVIADSSISRKHAQIQVSPNRIKVIDLGSSNGTKVNDQQITEQDLQYGDSIQFGNVVFKLLHTESADGQLHLASFFSQLRAAQTSYKLAAAGGVLSLALLLTSLFMTLSQSTEQNTPLQDSTLQRSYDANIQVNLHEAENFERQKKWSDAVSAYQTVLRKSPINRRARMGLADSRAALYGIKQLEAAKLSIKNNEYENAVRYLSEFKEDNSTGRQAKVLLAHARKNAALHYLKRADEQCRKKSWLGCQKNAIRVLTHESTSASGRQLVDLSEKELKKSGILFIPAVLSLP
ncbi:MAG: FHA domain-containing protein [Deltaproteobacteria bacterium]|jgi:pSer/pThr/pTyr-binding forkhead associated (FHA) protein|nr:FHA domain-containing protein [Deltaproteobacteria bacterium]MBT6431662.1 FHA domain-containing protein [Deltaproteobacteria bacterium]MBT6489850.1 FHA domain-containing protein [Deltaproteobacteria bacterium]